jgi:7-carboxy-7-deazaguanine synthase (Cx14CxxC type)
MAYAVKEIFYSLQGEGANTGRPAILCRFSGCNLWSGREEDRATAKCRFCDTDFFGVDGPLGGRYSTAEELAETVASLWPTRDKSTRMVVCTGGEPLLQLDQPLIDALRASGFFIAVETNGTVSPRGRVDWICVSPKAGVELKLTRGNELKLVYPQLGLSPDQFLEFEFDHFFLQPLDNPDFVANRRAALDYCLANPAWRLSLQSHKLLGIR